MTRAKVLEGQHLKTGDQEPDLLVQLIKDNRVPKDLSNVQDIEVHIKEANSNPDTIPIDSNLAGAVSIKAATDGKVSYSWQSGDTDTAATMVGEFVVIDLNGEQATYPNDGTFKVYIEEGIA
jgi:hypothetical protein